MSIKLLRIIGVTAQKSLLLLWHILQHQVSVIIHCMRFHWFHMFTNRTLIDFHNTWVKFLFLFIVTKFSIKPNLWNFRHKLIKHSSFSNNKIHNFPSIMYTPGDIREIMRRCIWNLLGKIFTLYDLKGILKQKLQTLLLWPVSWVSQNC